MEPGQVAIMQFPDVDLSPGKPRPVLLLNELPGSYDDWLICMFSTQMRQKVPGFDEIVDRKADDFETSGLKVPSIIRVTRVAVVESEAFIGSIGRVSEERLSRIRRNLSAWIAPKRHQ